ncbi:MAG TPA: class I SAM-dependent methyltransferase [Myxococcota bacterium]|nr:class I SAM-dependent methyltransferase [Myxococcota bacterium]
MAEHVCPPIIGYLLLSPFRKLFENPKKLFSPFVREGMTVLEPGPAMGFFTLPLARMVGPRGRVVALEVQQKMLDKLMKRARRAGLQDRIDPRLVVGTDLGISDLVGQVDFAAALYVVHEVPDTAAFFRELLAALKPGGKLLVVEPKGHVSAQEFEKTLETAKNSGFASEAPPGCMQSRSALLSKRLAA